MKRIAFKMYLKKGQKEEYIRRHREIWPGVVELLKRAGVGDYSIFLDEQTLELFAVQTIASGKGSQSLGEHRIIREWWDHMSDIMQVNPDNSPVTVELKQLFYLP